MSQQPSSTWAMPGVFVTIALVTGYVYHQARFETLRPPSSRATTSRIIAEENVSARLWEDPLAVSANHLAPQSGGKPSSDEILSLPRKGSLASSSTSEGGRVTVMMFMVQGGPYAEDGEKRIRDRVAATLSLGACGFVPERQEHMGIVKLPWPRSSEVRTKEWKELAQSVSLNPQRSIFDLCEALSSWCMPFTPAVEASTSVPSLELHVPFNWYRRDPLYDAEGIDPDEAILVMWLNEAMFDDRPLTRVALLMQAVKASLSSSGEKRFALMGPATSTTLESLLRDTHFNPKSSAGREKALKDLEIYCTRATAPLRMLSSNNAAICKVSDQMIELTVAPRSDRSEAVVVPLYRLVATDDCLVSALEQELLTRGVSRDDHVAVITELDSFYGRSIRKQFEHEWGPTRVHAFGYLRGIDGIGAHKTENSAGLPMGQDDDKKDQATTTEHAAGTNQMDYLRRLTGEIEFLSQRLHNDGKPGGLGAIGVAGSDLYDKLLVLQALRHRFPDVIFFTTDLDARLSDVSQIKWTRNLIVASAFGLRCDKSDMLDKSNKSAIPPFRDTYQTALFHAVSAAVQKKGNEIKVEDPVVAEIGLNGPHLLTGTTADLTPGRELWEWLTPDGRSLLFVFLGLGGFALLSYPMRQTFVWRRTRRRRAWKIVPTLAWTALAAVVLLALSVRWGHAGGAGEPFWLWAGTSIWPTVIIRGIALWLTLYFICLGLRRLRKSRWQLMQRYGLDSWGSLRPVRTPSPPLRSALRDGWSRAWHLIRQGWNLWEPPPSKLKNVTQLWEWYMERGRTGERVIRALVYAIGYFLFGMFILALFGLPDAPVRGGAARLIEALWLYPSVALLLFLMFLVVDATILAILLVRRLQGSHWDTTQYLAIQSACRPTAVPGGGAESHGPIAGWEASGTVQLIADLTRTVDHLIYYPFVILAIMFLARNSYFDAWAWPPGLLVILLLNAGIALACVVFLRRASVRARERQRQALQTRRLFHTGTPSADLDLVIKHINEMKEGAFAPLSEHPLFGSVLLVLGSVGSLPIIQLLSG